MDMELKDKFIRLWRQYFNDAALPIVCYYTNDQGPLEVIKSPAVHRCIFAEFKKLASGQTLCFAAESIGCGGGRRYLGFSESYHCFLILSFSSSMRFSSFSL